ncbi:MAG: hypothetical protein IT440_14265 [Phycisphaeraceae bacterium]|nr:hypothetical protein [Phycisphaeraceae bacterium]
MATMELECPQCRQVLEIDEAFAGSVCRCSHCGALMTVPAKESERPSARRPERPQSVGQTQHAASKLKFVPAPDPDDIPHVHAPARSSSSLRNTLAVVSFVALALVLLAVCFLAIRMVISSPDGNSAQLEQRRRDVLGYNPDLNPFTLPQPNLFGVQLVDGSAIVVDVSADSRYWWSLARDALAANLAKLSSGDRVQLYLCPEEGVTVVPATLTTWTDADRRSLTDKLGKMYAVGRTNLAPALAKAVNAGASRVVLLTSQQLTEDQVKTLDAALSAKEGVTLDVLTVDNDSPPLAQLASRHQGHMISLPLSKLMDWYQQAQP